MSTHENHLKSLSQVTFLIIFIILIFIILACVHFTLSATNFGNYDTIANIIDGFTAPFIGILASILTFLAFKMQINANEQVQNQFKRQQFESQFYEMINLHRKNADEISLKDYDGRKCFARIFNEFKFIFEEIKNKSFTNTLDIDQIKDLSVVILYFGTGNNVEAFLRTNISYISSENISNLVNMFNQYKKQYPNDNSIEFLSEGIKKEYSFGYLPFKGHISRLSHYFNNLLYTFLLVDQEISISFEDKKKYIEILKAQLSYYELILIDLYIVSILGKRWKDLEIKEKYNLFSEIDEMNIYSFN